MRPFEFGVWVFNNREKKYELDAGSLEGKYKDWQKKLHPDLVHNKSQVSSVYHSYAYHYFLLFMFLLQLSLSFEYEIVKQKERDYAADQSAKVTEAYRTLTKRLSRAMYIVSSSLYNALDPCAVAN